MRVTALAGPLLTLSACASSLEQHEALWASKGPASYHYTYTTTGFGPRLTLAVTVTARLVWSTTVISPPGSFAGVQGRTVEELFADVRHRLEEPCRVRASYDETLGYPLNVYSDCGEEGDGWNVRDFAVDAPDGGVP